jgi:peptidoglycan hydrolase CwlO-like protein
MRKRIVGAAALILATSSCATPKFQAALATEIRAAADELQAQRQDMALMQEQIDSLRMAVAKQDSVIKKLANLAGIPGL